MGKKVKPDQKGPPEDVFEPLLVESRQAGTVVLMLNSPEEEILAKACEAIYRFADKCDENRKTLLDLNVTDPLLNLIKHEDRIVRRNATMSLGALASNADVRRVLKKKQETIQQMINLLSPEEDAVIHEFAGLCLSSLASDYSSKVAIYKNHGLEPLVRCLSSHDPDVQKNAIETITLLLQDYQAKAALREANGFPPILDLLHSEYAVIQHLALVALQRASENAENRIALRELEAINRLIDFIGHPEWSDLHVFAVMVLSNCLEDSESIEMIKENGGLLKLVAFITDTQPPEEDDAKKAGGKDKKAAASRAGKKGKDEVPDFLLPSMRKTNMSRSISVARKRDNMSRVSLIREEQSSRMSVLAEDYTYQDEKSKSKGPAADVDSVTVTLPQVKEHACRAIARAAKNAENRKLLHEQEVEKMLILLLSHEDANVQVAAANALGVMAENLLSRESVGNWEGIEPLVKMLKSEHLDVKEAGSMALASLTANNMHNCQEIQKFKGLEALLDVLSCSRELAVANTACVLTNMAPNESLRSEILKLNVLKGLLKPLKSSNAEVQSKAALAVSAFTFDANSRKQFQDLGGIASVVQLLGSRDDEVRKSASWAVFNMAVDVDIAMQVSSEGGLNILQEIQISSNRQNAFSKLAFERLLDNNLSAKYALAGALSANNLISDGFIDVGQLRADTKFKTLEEYSKEEINQRRPIILVNAKYEKPPTPQPEVSDIDVTEKSSKSSLSVAGRSSRTSRETKSRSKHQKEKEHPKSGDEEEVRTKDGDVYIPAEGFTPPGDLNLVIYVNEVKDRIQPLPTTRDQVVALAQYVSEKMGGVIDRGQVANFSWELPLSQLKYEYKSNVIPIGMIRTGIHYHRALLFKVLADRIAVPCTLVRGEYNRAWNEVMLTKDQPNSKIRYPPSAFIVDLIHQPGRLMSSDSMEASSYQRI